MTALINEAYAPRAKQQKKGAMLCLTAIAAAEEIKYGATALDLLADHKNIDVEQGDMIYRISCAIEAEAESILAGADPANCSARIAEQLKRLFIVADDEQVDWGASVSVRFIGRAIEHEMQSLDAIHGPMMHAQIVEKDDFLLRESPLDSTLSS